ncbi:MAG: thiamine pyrophosphate-binding protein, partial [Pseudanabaena sp. ELA748]
MPIHQALTKSKKIRTILPRHEQGGGFAAEGYARVTGKAGVCMATSGPGATNAITGIATAYMDSIAMVVISGQVARESLGSDAFQETDMIGVSRPIVKHSFMVQNPQDIPEIIKKAFYIANQANLTLEELDDQEHSEIFFQDQRGAITKALKEGLQQGLQEGAQQQANSLVVRLLSRRFGELSGDRLAKLNERSASDLENLAEALLDFNDILDLDRWLAK